jgi:hypothetical protein
MFWCVGGSLPLSSVENGQCFGPHELAMGTKKRGKWRRRRSWSGSVRWPCSASFSDRRHGGALERSKEASGASSEEGSGSFTEVDFPINSAVYRTHVGRPQRTAVQGWPKAVSIARTASFHRCHGKAKVFRATAYSTLNFTHSVYTSGPTLSRPTAQRACLGGVV